MFRRVVRDAHTDEDNDGQICESTGEKGNAIPVSWEGICERSDATRERKAMIIGGKRRAVFLERVIT